MRQILAIVMVLGVLTATVQAQTLILPNSWDGEGWIFDPPNGCGLDYYEWLNPPPDPPPAGDPVIGPITGFRFDILSEERHVFWGVGLPAGFDDVLDTTVFTVTAEGWGSTTIQTSTWDDLRGGDTSNWVLFGTPFPGVKSFTITWSDPELFFDPENPLDQTIFPVWWGVAPHDCEATVKMTPIPEPSTLVLLCSGFAALLAFALRRRE